MDRVWVGFDLGGTKMLTKVYTDDFRELAKKRKRTRVQEGVKAGLKRLIGAIEKALQKAGVSPDALAGIGVGCPGPLDLKKGIVREAPNLGWYDVPLKKELEDAFGCPAVICNDVDAGVYGEYRFGAGRGGRCVVGVFPGTGIGGGCVYRGKIVQGERLSCMEIGHIVVEPEGPRCGCGQRGCLEAIASRLAIAAAAAQAVHRGQAPALKKLAGADVERIRSGVLAKAIEQGDEVVERIVIDAAETIGRALAGVVHLLAPDAIVLGGGLVEAMPRLFVKTVQAAVDRHVLKTFRGTYRVACAELGDDATVRGAAAWARDRILRPDTD
ncbi:MAG: ROK family protein [Planctomycetota bacterium]|nr:MAG: ROK family protein [Planctomycetota bacterium]